MDREARARHFLQSMEAIQGGRKVSFDDFLFHVEMQNERVQSGAPVGARLAAFSLPDQDGRMRTVADLSGAAGLLLVFVRSVNWCGYCRNQLAELNLSCEQLAARGIQIVAVAPDAADVVKEFHTFAGLRYPILVDEAARVIEQLGILNTNIPAGAPGQNKGRVPFPGHYLLDAEGTILDKEFTDDLRHRTSGTGLVFKHYGPDDGSTRLTIRTPEISVELIFATTRVHTGQQIHLMARFKVAQGWHVYGEPIPSRYKALSIAFDDGLLDAQRMDFPTPRSMLLEAVGETLPVHEGAFEASGVIELKWSPPVHGSRQINGLQERLASMQMSAGVHTLRGTLNFQACGKDSCLPAEAIPFELPITVEPDIGKVRAYFAGEVSSPKTLA